MSADSPRRSSTARGIAVAATVPPQIVSDRSILDSAIGFINDVTLAHQPLTDPKDTITWARFEVAADISDPRYGDDWELEGNIAPPLLLVLGYGLGVQVWAIPANGEAVEVLSWRHGIVSALRILPTPATCASSIGEHERADESSDMYAEKRPLIALVDGSIASAGSAQPQFCAVNFISLKTGAQVKTIKFKNPVLDVLANRSAIVITFHERIAVFDARTLEDRLSITTCYPSPGINPNPVTLGPRWLAYAENKLLHSKRSAAGCDGEGVASYTATVLNAAKSLGKGLRELGEQVAAGLTGTASSGNTSKNSSFESGSGPDLKHAGVVTILDVKHPIKDYSPTSGTPMNAQPGNDPIIAHFIAHSEALVAMEFDNSGMLLLTADRRGHDFHIFRIQPHSVGSSLAAVHHLYVLHRGDTSAKVQNIAFSLDSRWVAVSTLRGTTHVFPITPYGGPMGVRTHTSLHVVNKLSRFHRSAGLSADGRSSSPISHSESTTFVQSLQPYHNPTLPPFPRPTVVLPLTQLRQPLALGSPPGSAGLNIGGKAVNSSNSSSNSASSQRQRLPSLSDDNGKPLSVCAIFAKSRSWLLDPPNVTREAPHRIQRKAVDSLFIMAGHGALIQYDLDTKLASNVAKEKICDDTPIELEVAAKAQWNLGRRKDGSQELTPPLSNDNWLIKDRNSCILTDSTRHYDDADDRTESWLSQVEIITHAGPHRRLWMGPQFVFKTYNTPSGSNLSHVDAEAVEIGVTKATTATAAAAAATSLARTERSSPLNMPLTATGRAAVPVLIESGSYSSIEQSPKLMDRFRHDHLDSDFSVAHGDTRLKEDLADAMRESPSVSAAQKDSSGRLSSDAASSENIPFYDALTEHDDNDTNDDDGDNDDDDDDDDQAFVSQRSSASVAALANALPNIYSYDTSSSYESLESLKHKQKISIEKVVNPLGTVTTVTTGVSSRRDLKTDILDEVVSQLAAEDCVIHENCDEALFRPVVAIFCDDNLRRTAEEAELEAQRQKELCQPPEVIGNKLIVPVIAKEMDAELSRKEKEKTDAKAKAKQFRSQSSDNTLANACKSKDKTTKPLMVAAEDEKKKRIEANITAAATIKKSSKENLKEVTIGTGKKDVSKHQQEQQDSKISSEKIAETKSDRTLKEKLIETTVLAETTKISGDKGNLSNITSDNSQLKCAKEGKKLTPKIAASVNTANDNRTSSTIVSNTATVVEKEHSSIEEIKIIPAPKALTDPLDDNVSTKLKHTPQMNKSETSAEMKKIIGSPPPTTIATTTENHGKTQSLKSADDELVTPAKVKAPLTKGKKQKSSAATASNTASSSDSDEVIEVTVKTTRKSIDLAKKTPPPSLSSSDESSSFTDLLSTSCMAAGTKNSKDSVESAISVSFSKTKEKATVKATSTDEVKSVKDNNTLQLKSSDTLKPKYESETKLAADECKKLAPGDVEVETVKNSLKESTDPEKETKKEYAQSEMVGPSTIKSCKPHKDNENTSSIATSKKSAEVVIDSNPVKSLTTIKVANKEGNKEKISELTKSPEVTIKSPKKTNNKQMATVKNDAEITATATVTLPLSPNKRTGGMSKEKKQDPPLHAIEKESTAFKSDQPASTGKATDEHKISSIGTVSSSSADETDAGGSQSLTKAINNKKCAPMPTALPSAWKTMSGAEMINKNFESSKTTETNFPSLSKPSKSKKTAAIAAPSTSGDDKLLITDLSAAKLKSMDDLSESPSSLSKSNKKVSKLQSSDLNDFPMLKPLDALPPLPVLEPLEVITTSSVATIMTADDSKSRSTLREPKDISLINFESPLQERNPALERKITPPPRGFSEQNLILALCGSLHYENENARNEKIVEIASPTLSLTRSNSGIGGGGEHSVGDYKSLTENEEPYMSLEQSSQDTNTTNTATTNEKFSSSANSSASEDIIVVVEEKKMTKKQRRKKFQMELENQKEKTCARVGSAASASTIDVDEELRPLIGGMADSFVDTYTTDKHGEKHDDHDDVAASAYETAASSSVHLLIDDDNYSGPKASLMMMSTSPASAAHLGNSTTTEDSEGPMPATTSDDNNIIVLSSSTTSKGGNMQHKLKTKKLEHKINLIAAIEAATSSSTSSAEESGMETSRRSPDLDIGSCGGGGALISVAATPVLPLPHQMMPSSGVAIQQNAMKKKTKRRKR